MSMCTTIQGKGFTFIATDTAISVEINGEKYRTGFINKFYTLNRDMGVFLSGEIKYLKYIYDYLVSMKEIDIFQIHNFLVSNKNKNRLPKRVAILIVQRDKIVAMDWDNDFKIDCNYNPTRDDILDVQAFSDGGELAKEKVKEVLNQAKDVTENVIYKALLYGYKSVSRPNVGGDLNIHAILGKSPIKKVISLKIDDIKPVQMKDIITRHHLNINDKFTVDRNGNAVARSIKISGANSELDAKDMVVRNLIVGENVLMGDKALISWGNLPNDVAGLTDVPSDTKIKGLALDEVGEKLGITHTTIGRAFIESPSIRGGEITGGTLLQQNSEGCVYIANGSFFIEDGNRGLLGSIHSDNISKKMWIDGKRALKLTSEQGISLTAGRGSKIYLESDVVFSGAVHGCNVVFG